jgi:hypothetical protein
MAGFGFFFQEDCPVGTEHLTFFQKRTALFDCYNAFLSLQVGWTGR